MQHSVPAGNVPAHTVTRISS